VSKQTTRKRLLNKSKSFGTSKERQEVFSALESKFFAKEALLLFIGAFQLENHRSPTISHIYRTRLASQKELLAYLKEHIREGWVTEIKSHGNGSSYETKVLD
jgi:hypothetical protein